MLKKIISTITLVSILSFLFATCGTQEAPVKRIERICSIKLPKEMEVEYDYYQQAFHGDYTSFTVFKLEVEPTEFLEDNSFSEGIKNITYDRFDLWFPKYDVPKEYHLDFGDNYLVAGFVGGNPYAIAFYFPDTLKLIFYMHQG